ncbi:MULTISPECIES: hypothetical protein [Ralstonia]|nr:MULTISPECIES: hypothetical protein [Ralstonia]MDH6642540.1 hypothetical protein [Ralstonia sp. GP73]MDR9383003.1 hypothetical protein [Ralstonia sp. 11b]MEA3271909.1 hypothetical protein [Pseudomonadota bacterium]
MNAQFKTWMAWALAAAGAALIFAAWLTPEGALSFVTLASFCG